MFSTERSRSTVETATFESQGHSTSFPEPRPTFTRADADAILLGAPSERTTMARANVARGLMESRASAIGEQLDFGALDRVAARWGAAVFVPWEKSDAG